MEALTIRDAGAEGVYQAISDGMKAATYARELDAAIASNDLLTAQNDALRAEIADKDREIVRLRKQCREYRFARSRAYAQALEAQSVSAADGPARRWMFALAAGIGAVVISAIYFAIVWCA